MNPALLRMVFAVALATTFTYAPRTLFALQMKAVDCGTIDLKYDGEATSKRCTVGDETGNQTEVKIQQLVAQSVSYEMVATYLAGQFRTYFPEQPLREQIDSDGYFADTDNWQPTRQFSGFEVAVFEGFEKAGGTPTLCAAFSKYTGIESGAYEFPQGPGYRNNLKGIYCALTGQATLISPPDNFYRLMQDVLSKLHDPQ